MAGQARILSDCQTGGLRIAYLSGEFIYAVQTYDSGVDPDDALSDTMAGSQKPDYLRIVRAGSETRQAAVDSRRSSAIRSACTFATTSS
jgi:hypothetical protein